MKTSLTALACLLVVVAAPNANAFAVGSAIGVGCHERFTMEALRAVRARQPTVVPVKPGGEDAALINDLAFTLDPDMKDLSGATITVGVRDNDLKGRGPAQMDQLAMVHGDPAGQREHCLRAIDDDEPTGSPDALESCKAFIRERVSAALDGLDGESVPDSTRRTPVVVMLGLRGQVTAPLPTYWLNMGRALHTLQDAFSHTFRSPDRMEVRTVLNWIEYVGKTEVESRDGPLHRSGLDECENVDAARALDIAIATKASTALLTATLDPALTRAAKLAAVDAVLDEYLTFTPGCTLANGWCEAPERTYSVTPSLGCSSGGAPGGAFAVFAVVFFGLWLTRRRTRATAALVAAFAVVAVPGLARAEEQEVTGVPTATEKKSEQIEQVQRRSVFGLYVAVSGSVTAPGASPQVGLRFRLSDRWTVGLDAELNGWFSLHTSKYQFGAVNAYATGIFRTPLRFERFNLRTTASLGTSVMLIDLYGAPAGSVGLFAQLVPLGFEWKASSALYVVWDALGIALPIPHLTGAPFAYPQYRTALGIELAF